MPTYQYACTACGEQLEAVQSFTDAALTECPACGGALRKVFSAVGVVFKGSGFYKTDSRKRTTDDGGGGEKKTDAGKKETSAGTDSAPKSESKSSDSKATPSTSSTPAAKSA
ncbi:MAG: FmdB family transcriptional regulator [Frankiaceae bacterium]|nr:FmdB family transcriptional regulator [Frankiaceae bacterium]